MSCGLFTLNLAQKGISKLPEKSQNEQSFKNGPSHGDRANVVTGREMAGELALRSSSHSALPLWQEQGPPPQQLSPALSLLPVHRTPRCSCSPQPQIVLVFLPSPEDLPVAYHIPLLQRPGPPPPTSCFPLKILQQRLYTTQHRAYSLRIIHRGSLHP